MQCFWLTHQDGVAHLMLNQPATLNTMQPTFWRELDEVLTALHHVGHPLQPRPSGRRRAAADGLDPGRFWSNAHVREAVTAMKEKRAGVFPDLSPLSSFKDL